MGEVYRATHLGTKRTVALKVIHPQLSAHDQFLARFRREAEAAGRLRHPNVVDVTDFGIAQTKNGPVAYLVMEYLDGCTLAEIVAEEGVLPIAWVIDILEQVCAAVEEAHRAGIIHRDLKPENIWLEPNGRGGYTVKVLDFGVAKMKLAGDLAASIVSGNPDPNAGEAQTVVMDMRQEPPPGRVLAPAEQVETLAMARFPSDASSGSFGSDGGQTMLGSLVGTPAYMSPEQALGEQVDFRSDIYSLAVVAYSLVCGRL